MAQSTGMTSIARAKQAPAAGGGVALPADRLRVYGALALGICCIALSAIFTRLAHVPGTVSGFYRVAIAEVVLLPLFLRSVARGEVGTHRDPESRPHEVKPWGRRVWLLALLAGLFFALDLGLWNTSLFLTPVANATLLANDAPIVVGLIAVLILHERLRGSYWLGLAVALAGMGIIVGQDALASSGHLGAGDALALLAGVSYALYLTITPHVRAHMTTLASLWIPGLAGMLVLLAFNLAAGRALWGFSGGTWLALLAVGLISQAVGWLAINYALGHMPASVVSVTLLAQPVLTALFAVPLLGEALAGRQILGGAVALAGIYLVNRGFVR
jgi:drug/metabolite transporter (DMT)-like permease